MKTDIIQRQVSRLEQWPSQDDHLKFVQVVGLPNTKPLSLSKPLTDFHRAKCHL